MKFLYELIITAMETFGLIFVAVGLGLFASWIAGSAGFYTVMGLALLGAAYLAARQQDARETKTKPKAPPPRPPMTRSAQEVPHPVDAKTQRIRVLDKIRAKL